MYLFRTDKRKWLNASKATIYQTQGSGSFSEIDQIGYEKSSAFKPDGVDCHLSP